MLKMPLALLTVLISFSSFAEVSFEEKKNRVEFLEELSSKAVAMNIDAYRRELQYEKEALPLATRAKIEANRLAEKIKIQVQKSYEAALEDASPGEAVQEVTAAIEKDLELVSPELRDEIRRISLEALRSVETGGLSSQDDLLSLEEKMLKSVKERYEYLNRENKASKLGLKLGALSSEDLRNPNQKEYSDRREIVKALVSEFESASWISGANTSVRSNVATKTDTRVSFQVKAQFLGVSLEAGPTIAFKREFKTNVSVVAEGLSPVLLSDGNFDFFKRDSLGRTVQENGEAKRRNIVFTCDASLAFESAYAGAGGFSVAGIGGGTSVATEYGNNVSLTSRRITVPEYLDGKSVTMKLLTEICHEDFLRGKVTETMTIADSLNVMMKNVISGLTFSHPKTKCLTDAQCLNWFNNELIGLVKLKNTPRCVEEKRENFFSCELRGLKGQNCAVFDAQGRRISDGMFEYQCDAGLKCVKVQEEGWFKNWELYQYARGKCLPAEGKTNR
jgi:hypothetical protein